MVKTEIMRDDDVRHIRRKFTKLEKKKRICSICKKQAVTVGVWDREGTIYTMYCKKCTDNAKYALQQIM